MISANDFHALRALLEAGRKGYNTESNIDEGVILSLKEQGLINDKLAVTPAGKKALEPYRVTNAIILAAGMASRFAPVSYELPKGLIQVKGEVLIERQIRQLREAGVKEIVVVVGYMMEKFVYLRNKYDVKLVVNNEYSTLNTHSSMYFARDYMSNTYVCCSDNYYPENPFHQFEYHAFYCSIYLPGTSEVERAFTFDDNGLIIDTNKPSCDQWIMYGHAYYDKEFTSRFKPMLESYFGRPGVEYMYWETIYAENVKDLPMHIMKCTVADILEFDSVEELRSFDPDFLEYNFISPFNNICKVLDCKYEDIDEIEPINAGLNNSSFKFRCKDGYYVYRHPGINAAGVIDREKEKQCLELAYDLGIDETLVAIDTAEGWKISRFVVATESFDFSNKQHISMLAKSLKKLHESRAITGFKFDYWEEADALIEEIKMLDNASYEQILAYRTKMLPLKDFLSNDEWQTSLCHNDLYEPNLLVEGDKLHVIDWEFSGDSDIGYDICKLFSVHNPSYEEIDEWLLPYYGRKLELREKIHLLSCAAMIYYYWFVWAVYVSHNDAKASDYLDGWHNKMVHFREETTELLSLV